MDLYIFVPWSQTKNVTPKSRRKSMCSVLYDPPSTQLNMSALVFSNPDNLQLVEQ